MTMQAWAPVAMGLIYPRQLASLSPTQAGGIRGSPELGRVPGWGGPGHLGLRTIAEPGPGSRPDWPRMMH